MGTLTRPIEGSGYYLIPIDDIGSPNPFLLLRDVVKEKMGTIGIFNTFHWAIGMTFLVRSLNESISYFLSDVEGEIDLTKEKQALYKSIAKTGALALSILLFWIAKGAKFSDLMIQHEVCAGLGLAILALTLKGICFVAKHRQFHDIQTGR